MRILLLNQFFWPSQAATSQLLTDLARSMAADGHRVTVICGTAAYSAGDSAGERPPVEILPAPSLGFSRGVIGRLASYGSFWISALFRGLTVPKPDVVVCLTTPPLLPIIGAIIKLLRGSQHFIWEMDIYPAVAVDVGFMRQNGWLTRILGRMAAWSHRHADGILALGDCMKDRLIGEGVLPEKIHVTENWADGTQIRPEPFRADNVLKVHYSGNFGLAHDIDTIRGAIRRLRSDGRFRFHFCGAGARYEELQRECEREEISNVTFSLPVQHSALSSQLGTADIGLVTQKSECCGSVVPSKSYGLLAAGRPLLFVGPKDATPSRIIDQFRCGWHVDCDAVDELVQLLEMLSEHPELVHAAGQRGREAFLAHYDLPAGVKRIEQAIGIVSERKVQVV